MLPETVQVTNKDAKSKGQRQKEFFDGFIDRPDTLFKQKPVRTKNFAGTFTDYTVRMLRIENKWWLVEVTWVDNDGEGYRIYLPHEVVEAERTLIKALIKKSRSRAAEKATATIRSRNGAEPGNRA
jgi:hypothetical protein